MVRKVQRRCDGNDDSQKYYENKTRLCSLDSTFQVPFLGNSIHGHDVQRFTETGVRVLAESSGFTVLESLALGKRL